jgi:hypothetical protein
VAKGERLIELSCVRHDADATEAVHHLRGIVYFLCCVEGNTTRCRRGCDVLRSG